MRLLTARLEDGYCSITVVNYGLITVIRFVAQSCTHMWKGFANKFRLVLHVCKIFFVARVAQANQTEQLGQVAKVRRHPPAELRVGDVEVPQAPEAADKLWDKRAVEVVEAKVQRPQVLQIQQGRARPASPEFDA